MSQKIITMKNLSILLFCLVFGHLNAQDIQLAYQDVDAAQFAELPESIQKVTIYLSNHICGCIQTHEATVSEFIKFIDWTEEEGAKVTDEAALVKFEEGFEVGMEKAEPYLSCLDAFESNPEFENIDFTVFDKLYPDLNQTDLAVVFSTYLVYTVKRDCSSKLANSYKKINIFMTGLEETE